MSFKFAIRLLIAVSVWIIVLLSVGVRADFVSDPLRDDSKGFPSFFLSRLEKWSSRFSRFEIDRSPIESEYIDAFDKTVTKFGVKKTSGFLRAADYKIRAKSLTYKLQTVRLLDLENRSELRGIADRLLNKVAPKFDRSFLQNKEMGFGFGRKDADVEIVFWEDNLTKSPYLVAYPELVKQIAAKESGEIVLAIRNSKIISVEVVQLGKAPPPSVNCPAAVLYNQTDRVLYSNGETSWVWHLDRFEDLAIGFAGRKIYEILWTGLNLNPGAIEWRSKDDYALSYP